MTENIKRALKILDEILDDRAFQRDDYNVRDWSVWTEIADKDQYFVPDVVGSIEGEADNKTHDCWEHESWALLVKGDGTFIDGCNRCDIYHLKPFPQLPEDNEEAKEAIKEWFDKNNGFFHTDLF